MPWDNTVINRHADLLCERHPAFEWIPVRMTPETQPAFMSWSGATVDRKIT